MTNLKSIPENIFKKIKISDDVLGCRVFIITEVRYS